MKKILIGTSILAVTVTVILIGRKKDGSNKVKRLQIYQK